MKTKGYAVLEASKPLVPFNFDRRELRPTDIALEIHYAGICHSDIHQAREEWGPAIFPMVPGHEIAGVVTEIGTAVSKFKVGDRIGVGVFIDSCRKCSSCKAGLEQYCLEGMTGTYNGYERDGKTVAQGGYSNLFVVDQDYAVTVPANLEMSGVAPLLCAGITLYSPLKNWGAGAGKKVGVIGLGGLGHMGVKFAVALGAHTTVFSHSPNKESDAKAMGAHEFVVTKDPKNLAQLSKDYDLILNTVSADMDLTPFLDLLKLDGTLVLIGLPGKPYEISTPSLLAQRRSIAGSMIGGIAQTQEMLNFCGEHNIVSDVEVIEPGYINEAYERTVASDVKYRFVIDAKKF
ncbi:MAG: NAD(P)-dependent alcohol dehydrogenase [Candidatus Nanopelagicaceae bacterium]